ncbi:MAG: hypothetical protein WD294_09335 [Phycisphaeraceae bacterium]
MNEARKHALLYGMLLVMLAVAAVWNFTAMTEQRALAHAQAEDLLVCATLADQIKTLRTGPGVASSEAKNVQELGQRIEAASQQAGLSGELVGVAWQNASRIGETDYVRKPVRLSLRGVSLPQMTTFLHHVTNASAVAVRDLRISGRNDASETWQAEAALTSLVYQPLPEE